MSPRQFGAQIRQRRLEHHLEIEQLAELVGVSPVMLRDIERGQSEEGDHLVIHDLDHFYDCPPDDRLAFAGFEQLFPVAKDVISDADLGGEHFALLIILKFPTTRDRTCHETLQC